MTAVTQAQFTRELDPVLQKLQAFLQAELDAGVPVPILGEAVFQGCLALFDDVPDDLRVAVIELLCVRLRALVRQ